MDSGDVDFVIDSDDQDEECWFCGYDFTKESNTHEASQKVDHEVGLLCDFCYGSSVAYSWMLCCSQHKNPSDMLILQVGILKDVFYALNRMKEGR